MNIRKNRWQGRGVLKKMSNRKNILNAHHPQVRRLIINANEQIRSLIQ